MFQDCVKLSSIDLSTFNLAKVTTMLGTFLNCPNLENVNFGNT